MDTQTKMVAIYAPNTPHIFVLNDYL